MDHFVQYHNTKKMGPLVPGAKLHVLANKPVAHMLGATVWLISGEGQKEKDFFLRLFFVTDQVEASPTPGFKWMISGSKGQVLSPWKQLTIYDWFREFQESQQNFRGGMWPLRLVDIEHFKHLVQRS